MEQDEKQKAVEALLADFSEEHLWACIVAFQNVLTMKEGLSAEEKPYVKRPKALGDIRGVSYIYPLFDRFGLIETGAGKRSDAEHGVQLQLCLQLEEMTEGEPT